MGNCSGDIWFRWQYLALLIVMVSVAVFLLLELIPGDPVDGLFRCGTWS